MADTTNTVSAALHELESISNSIASAKGKLPKATISKEIVNPCFEQKVCGLKGSDFCKYCGLTQHEFKMWAAYSGPAQVKVYASVKERLQQH